MIVISFYQFIASEHELPALLSPKLHNLNDGGIFSSDTVGDFGDLEIVQEMVGYLFVDISVYTKLKYIYRLNLEYTPERGLRLCEYLKKNCQSGHRYELWTIDMGAETQEAIHEELVHLHRTYTSVEQLTERILAAEGIHPGMGKRDYPRVLILQ